MGHPMSRKGENSVNDSLQIKSHIFTFHYLSNSSYYARTLYSKQKSFVIKA